MDAEAMISNLNSIDIRSLCIETAEDSEEQMVNAMEDQLAQGLRADGSMIAPPYSPFTISLKEQKTGLSSVTDVVTLFDTGEHYSKLFADVQDDIIEYGSKDSKSPGLQKKYGDQIYGLNEESREALIDDYVYDRLAGKVERASGLSFSK